MVDYIIVQNVCFPFSQAWPYGLLSNTKNWIVKSNSSESDTVPSIKLYNNFKDTNNQATQIKQREFWDMLSSSQVLPSHIEHALLAKNR